MWVLTLLLWSTTTVSLDFDSYCAGFCRARYADGIYRKGKCFCGDYYPLNLENRIRIQAKPAPMSEGYDGKDEMHYAPVDE